MKTDKQKLHEALGTLITCIRQGVTGPLQQHFVDRALEVYQETKDACSLEDPTVDVNLLKEVREQVQYALDSFETARLNQYIPHHAEVFFEGSLGELRAARIRLTQELKKAGVQP